MSQVGMLLASSGEKPGRDAVATMHRTAPHNKDPCSPKRQQCTIEKPCSSRNKRGPPEDTDFKDG